jgi:hypothetical protein
MNVKHKLILIVLASALGVTTIWFGCYAFKAFNEMAKKTAYYSAMSWLDAAISEELSKYYGTYGHYPAELTDLTIPFPGDNAKPEMLKNFEYSTDGTSYEIICNIDSIRRETRKEQASAGKIIFAEDYIDGQLCRRTEHPSGYGFEYSGVEKVYRHGKLVSTTVYKNGKVISKENH